MFDSNQFFGVSAEGAFYPKTIDQSLRFEDGDDASLTRTPSVAGNQKTWTWSGWVKRGNLGTLQSIFIRDGNSDSTFFSIRFNTSNNLEISQWNSRFRTTSAVFRDPSAWYHIVVAFDTTEATASDRVKLWINGTEETNFSTTNNPTLNADYGVNSTAQHCFGRDVRQSNFEYDGYLAEVHFTDGTAYTADDFGELKSGIWVPKSPSVTYGTNGFKLTFEDSAAIGDDTSGNGNDWTVNNLVASDVVPDSPTNNFCTLNPVEFVNNSGFLSEGNLKISDTSSSNLSASGGTIGMTSGKWYWEAHLIVQENGFNIGVVKDTESATSGTWNYTKTNFYAINGLGTSYVSDGAGAQNAAGTTFAQGDTVQVAYDADTGKLYFGKNGTWLNSADPAAGTGNLETTSDPAYGYHPATSTIGDASGYSDVIMNFGQDSTFAGNLTAGGNTDANGIGDFKYTVPSGFLALCTSNLPDPVIDPAQDATPEDHFNVALYTGNGSTQSITGVGHQPDFVWIKARVNRAPRLYDSVRGVGNDLRSNVTNAEAFDANGLTGFNADGFTVGSTDEVNYSGNNFVAWNWKAGGTGVSNTDGTITSTVSANTDAGFSIVSFTANNTAGATVGHGLTQAPEMFIVKDRDSPSGWGVYHSALGGTQYLSLQATHAATTNSTWWNNTDPDDSVFTLGTSINYLTDDNIAYCFHSVDGFSKVGSFVGNGNADGTFVYTGFRPAFVMYKRTNSTSNWTILDNSREGYNVDNDPLYPNLSNAEGTTDLADLVSNGFKLRTTDASVNASGGAYIYLAFAEQPFKFSNSR